MAHVPNMSIRQYCLYNPVSWIEEGSYLVLAALKTTGIAFGISATAQSHLSLGLETTFWRVGPIALVFLNDSYGLWHFISVPDTRVFTTAHIAIVSWPQKDLTSGRRADVVFEAHLLLHPWVVPGCTSLALSLSCGATCAAFGDTPGFRRHP